VSVPDGATHLLILRLSAILEYRTLEESRRAWAVDRCLLLGRNKLQSLHFLKPCTVGQSLGPLLLGYFA
jgi:hypothetical protein